MESSEKFFLGNRRFTVTGVLVAISSGRNRPGARLVISLSARLAGQSNPPTVVERYSSNLRCRRRRKCQ